MKWKRRSNVSASRSGAEDQRLVTLAERFGGVLLSEIYDDYHRRRALLFGAVRPFAPRYRGARSVAGARCWKGWKSPEDLYLIEGDHAVVR
ncbi:hypothetical protein M8494_16210 [Serratia ureilytica]